MWAGFTKKAPRKQALLAPHAERRHGRQRLSSFVVGFIDEAADDKRFLELALKKILIFSLKYRRKTLIVLEILENFCYNDITRKIGQSDKRGKNVC